MRPPLLLLLLGLVPAFVSTPASASASPPPKGYYRQPSLRGDTLVFVSEGDIWRATLSGTGRATRLTTHPGAESMPVLSPDGTMVAFTATYDGPLAAYVMPTAGGLPKRLTWDGNRVGVSGWTRDGRVIVTTDALSALPATQSTMIDPNTGVREVLPLAQAAGGAFTKSGAFIFTRFAFQGSQTARYQGGTAQALWRWDPAKPDAEATPLTPDFPGTSKDPMPHNGKVYFLSDRDGTMNVWVMGEDGASPAQVTHSVGWDVQSASLDASGANARIAYRVGADIHLLDLASGADQVVDLTLDSDLDQTREHWVPDPMAWVSDIGLSPDGDRVVLTARGRVWVIPKTPGRVVSLTPSAGVRWRGAQFTPDGESVVGLSDVTGEIELAEVPADGSAGAVTLTSGADAMRWEVVLSPDGKLIANTDKDQRLYLYDRAAKTNTLLTSSSTDIISNMQFSPDSKVLAWEEAGNNGLHQLHVEDLATHQQAAITTGRYDSWGGRFSPDGKWLYFLSDRNFVSSVGSPWGPYAPQPHFDHRTQIFALALQPDTLSPFQPWDELHRKPADDAASADADAADKKKPKKADKNTAPEATTPAIVMDGLSARLWPVPVAPGNYSGLSVSDTALYWLSSEGTGESAATSLQGLTIGNDPPEVKTLVPALDGYELSQDGSRLLVIKEGGLSIVDAEVGELDLSKAAVDLSGWSFSVSPREEWRQMFVEAWRLERDYFYAPNMNGVDWQATLNQFLPLVDRVRSRAELSDLVAQMVSKLSTLHTFVYGGDVRVGPDWVQPASLGAKLAAVEGGLVVERIYQSDPDLQARRSPLQVPGVDFRAGDVIVAIDHQPVASEAALAAALRNHAGHPVLVSYRRASVDARGRHTTADLQALVTPLDPDQDRDLRYLDWEMQRRDRVDTAGKGTIGYVHLRAMGEDDIAQWTREYFAVFDRQGLIVDVRHNRGGNIDSWILGQLLRRPWMQWSQRVGSSASWNMQSAFRGPVVVLCDESTASDGEAFSEGIKRLGIGKVIGTRTWGGEVWLSSSNFLVDGGIATAAEFGVYGPEGKWLIEGHGVDPDEVVDNLPRSTYDGGDAQLDAALRYLDEELKAHPVLDAPHPAWPTDGAR